MKEFENNLKTIYYFAHEYGHEKFLKKNPNFDKPDKKTFPFYMNYCHEGFYKAQELIVDHLIVVQKAQQILKKEHKKAKKEQDPKQITNIKNQIQIEESKNLLLRHAADSIAWQIIRGQHHIARRLFANEQQPTLLGNNLESLRDYIKYYKKENPSGFCLISDITSFVQTGDLVCISEGGIQIVELKTGSVNEKIMQILDQEYSEGKAEFCETAHEKGIGFVKQFNRVLNQKRTLYEISNILKNDIGFDPRLKKDIKILDPNSTEENYYKSISELMEKIKSSKQTYAIDIVEKCVYIGVYKEIGRVYGPHTLKMWMNHETNSNYPVTNFLHMLHDPIKEPITYKPFDKDETFDILFGRICIYIAINFNYLFEMAKYFGLEMKWVGKKALSKAQQKGMDCFKVNKKGISISDGKSTVILGDHFFSRILHDFILPSSLFLTYKSIFRDIGTEQFFKIPKT